LAQCAQQQPKGRGCLSWVRTADWPCPLHVGLALNNGSRCADRRHRELERSAYTPPPAPPGRPARDTVVGPRPAGASWTYNAQPLGHGPEPKMPWSNFRLIPRDVAIQVQRSAISTTLRQASRFGSGARRARAPPMGPRGAQREPSPMPAPHKKFVVADCVGVALDEGSGIRHKNRGMNKTGT
jgi:hypothetical protein